MRDNQDEIMAKLESTVNSLKPELKNIHCFMRRSDPFNRLLSRNSTSDTVDTNDVGSTSSLATLSKCPKTLHILWDEYEKVIGGRKPAKKFTYYERGKCKSAYCRRKRIWDLIEKIMSHGHSCDVAIEKI